MLKVTGPWTHAGTYTSLETVIKHHLGPQSAIDNFDESQLTQSDIQNLDKLKANAQLAPDSANLEIDRVLLHGFQTQR
ncbi:MAG: Unknown protein [uncultured Thiotrichaceae bacterium]|uniref:Uncharacterized protein n=1 Tax=uncultured Thiotrichaceae bacterium TaxID=298394 RepID=A0A6S6TNU9_9GAMM|nr:MAG: Unknown protein [uncultured Thiotrichaceae bacterium]